MSNSKADAATEAIRASVAPHEYTAEGEVEGKAPIVLAAVSDIHAGSAHGLCPAEGILLEGDALYTPGPAGRRRWGYWLDYWNEVATWRDRIGARLVVLLNGDLTDGRTFRDQELIDSAIGTQVSVALQCFRPMAQVAPDRLYITRGTPVHVGSQAGLERAVGKALLAEKDPVTKTRAAYSWLLSIHGRRIFATHHPPSTGRLVRTRKSQTALAANEIASRFMERRGPDGRPLPPPDIAIFSHAHEPDDSGPVLPHRVGTRALRLGPWQGKTQYAQKVAPVALGEESHGIMVTIWPEAWRMVQVDHLVYPQKLSISETVV